MEQSPENVERPPEISVHLNCTNADEAKKCYDKIQKRLSTAQETANVILRRSADPLLFYIQGAREKLLEVYVILHDRFPYIKSIEEP
jgi:hypothetical protein